MLRNSSFWKTECDAPLLARNAGFVTKENADQRCQEAQKWLQWVPQTFKDENSQASQRDIKSTKNEEMDRLFYQDAVRTFTDEALRGEEVAALNAVYEVTQNYHQGLGFVVSFLLLFLERKDTIVLALFINKEILPGYFKTHNREYLKDARVFEALLFEKDPPLARHLHAQLVPGQYCSKWFIGMTIHVFPFRAVFEWFGTVLEHGNIQNFKLGLSIMQTNRKALLGFDSASSMVELLRFDKNVYPDTLAATVGGLVEDSEGVVGTKISDVEDANIAGSFFTSMIRGTLLIDLDSQHVKALREKAELAMVAEEELRQKALDEISDEEITFSDEEEEDDD